MCQQPPLAYFCPQRNNKVAWLYPTAHLTHTQQAPHIRLLSFCAHAWGRRKAWNRILLLESHWRQCEDGAPFLFFSPSIKNASHESPPASRHPVTPPFCKTTIINQNPISQHRQLLLEWQMFGGPSPASFPTVLFITFPSLTYSPQPQPPSPLLSAWNRHSGKYILCKLSSRCYSWFHKWWWNGQESEGVNGKRWLLHATTVFLRSPFS